jgi:alkyl hydroperoxide reductase subunit AhpF
MLIGSLGLMLGGMAAAVFTASRADAAAAVYAATAAVRTGVAATR